MEDFVSQKKPSESDISSSFPSLTLVNKQTHWIILFYIVSRQRGWGTSLSFTSRYASATALTLAFEVSNCITKHLSASLWSKEVRCSRSSESNTRISYWRDFHSDVDDLSRNYDFKTAQVSMVLVLLLTSPQNGLSNSQYGQPQTTDLKAEITNLIGSLMMWLTQ